MLVEDDRQFIDQRDVDVALGVLDDLGRLGNANAARLVRARDNDLAVQLVDELGYLRRRSRRYLFDIRHAVGFVAGIDPLGTVANEEIHVEFQPRHPLEHRNAFLFRRTRIDGRFIDDDVVLLQHAADGFAGADQGSQVGTLVVVDRRRDGGDIHVAGLHLRDIAT